MDNDRLVLHTVHTDDGATELYFGRASDDMLVTWDGSFLFHHQGDDQGVTYKLWTPDADVPLVVHIEGGRVRVTVSEDQPPFYEGERAGPVLFDSNTVKWPVEPPPPIEDPTREVVFAIGAADVSDPANLRWLARCAEARAAELES